MRIPYQIRVNLYYVERLLQVVGVAGRISTHNLYNLSGLCWWVRPNQSAASRACLPGTIVTTQISHFTVI